MLCRGLEMVTASQLLGRDLCLVGNLHHQYKRFEWRTVGSCAESIVYHGNSSLSQWNPNAREEHGQETWKVSGAGLVVSGPFGSQRSTACQ